MFLTARPLSGLPGRGFALYYVLMVDKVKPIGWENTVDGGSSNNVNPSEIDPDNDYISTKGVAFTGLDTRLVDLNVSGEISATDSFFTTKTALVDILPYYQFVADATETNTTSTAVWSTKLTLTTPSLRIGTYKLNWTFKWRALNANREIDIRIRDGATVVHTSIESYLRTQGIPSVAGYEIFSGISGVKTFTVEFKVFTTATTVYCADALLDIQRVIKT